MRPLSTKAGVGVAAAAALVLSAHPATASELPCFDQATMQSARIHDLRLNFMVNALKCRFRNPETLNQYGRLLDRRSDELVEHGNRVLGAMTDRYGPVQGKLAFQRYETTIANYHSYPAPSPEQCDELNAFMKLAERADHAELESLSRMVTNRAIDLCLVPDNGFQQASARPAGPAVVRVNGRAVAIEAPEIVDGIPTYPGPGIAPDTAPEPLETVAIPAAVLAVAEPAPTAPDKPDGADERLDRAIVALNAAAAALSDLRREP